MNDPLVAVAIVEDPNTFINGVAIKRPGHDPVYFAPFPSDQLKAAYALNGTEVVLAASTSHPKLVIAKVNAFTGNVTHRVSMDDHWNSFLLSGDRRTLYAAGLGLIMLDVQSFSVRASCNRALMSDMSGRLVHTKDYFAIDPTISDRDSRVFHSEKLKDEYNRPGISHLFMWSDAPIEEIEEGQLRLWIKDASLPLVVDILRGTIAYCQISAPPAKAPPNRKEPTSTAIVEGFSAFVRQLTFVRISVDDWTSAACARGLNEQEERIRNDYARIVVAGTGLPRFLNFEYFVAGQSFSEEAFFQNVLDNDLAVAVPLRRLIRTYLSKIDANSHPWQSGTGPALCSAMRALALLDPKSIDLLKLFLKKRDYNYDPYCYKRIVTVFGEKYDWENERAMRLGLHLLS